MIVRIKSKKQIYGVYRKCTFTIKIQLSYKKKHEKMYNVKNSHKKAQVTILILDKVNFRTRNNNRDEENLIKG